MESFVDVITTSFQAILAVCVVFTAGYYSGKHGAALSSVRLDADRASVLVLIGWRLRIRPC
jgi:hypothetical protein